MDLEAFVRVNNSDIHVHDPANGMVMASDLNFGEVTHRRGEIESPFIPGTYYSYEIQDQTNLTVGFRISGASTSQVADRIQIIKSAFTHPEYELHMTIDDLELAWQCYAADFTVSPQREQWHARKVTIAFDVPRNPQPIKGPF